MTSTITLVTLLALALAFTRIARRTYDDGVEIVSGVLAFNCYLLLTLHVLALCAKSHNHDLFVAKRDAFVSTLTSRHAKWDGSVVTVEVAKWNVELAERQLNRSHWLLGQYVDARVSSLTPIK